MTTDEMCVEVLKKRLWEVNIENGAVFSHQANKYVGGSNTKGYRVATLHLRGERRQVKLHRLVWIAVNGIPPLGYVIDHVNGKKDDNRLSNLRLADTLLNSTNRRSYKGEANPAAKITRAKAEVIRKFYADRARKVRHGRSFRTIASRFNISPTLVAKIIRKEIWN